MALNYNILHHSTLHYIAFIFFFSTSLWLNVRYDTVEQHSRVQYSTIITNIVTVIRKYNDIYSLFQARISIHWHEFSKRSTDKRSRRMPPDRRGDDTRYIRMYMCVNFVMLCYVMLCRVVQHVYHWTLTWPSVNTWTASQPVLLMIDHIIKLSLLLLWLCDVWPYDCYFYH